MANAELAFSKHDFLRGAKRRAFRNDSETNLVQYPKFIADVDYKVGLIFGDRASTALLAREIPPYGFDNSDYLVEQRSDPKDNIKWKRILEKLSAFVYRRSLRLVEFFEGFDPLRHGTCTKQKFRTVCGQLNLPLNETQIETVDTHSSRRQTIGRDSEQDEDDGADQKNEHQRSVLRLRPQAPQELHLDATVQAKHRSPGSDQPRPRVGAPMQEV